MNCNISTGTVVSPSGDCGSGAGQVTSSGIVLFDAKTTNTVSRDFLVTAGQAVSLVAFDLQDEQVIHVNRIILGGREFPQVGSCCPKPSTNTGGVVMSEQHVVTNGKAWQLTNQNNQMVVSMPGVYRLELGSEDMLGTVYAEMTMMVAPLPENVIAGAVIGG